jgi:hypothetical protein
VQQRKSRPGFDGGEACLKITQTVEKDILVSIFDGFNRADVRYIVVGGLAVVAHGYVRLTHDIDLVFDMEEKNLKRAMNVLTTLDYYPRVPVKAVDFAIAKNREKWITEKNMVVFSMISDTHRDTVVDIFVRTPFDFDEEDKTVIPFDLCGVRVPIVSKSTLIRLKQKAARPKDLLDIEFLSKS